MTNEQKAQQGIDSLKEAICDEIRRSGGITIPKLSKKLNLKVPDNEHGIEPHYLTWSIVCMLKDKKKISGNKNGFFAE